MGLKYVRFGIPAVVAGAQTGPTNVASFDDNVDRRVVGILSTNATKLIHEQLDVVGKLYADVDNGIMAQQRGFIPIDQVIPAGVLISVNVLNGSGGALAAATDAVVIAYTVADGGSGTPPKGTFEHN